MHFHDLLKKYDQTLQCLIFLEKINLIHWNGRNTHILLTKLVVKVFLKLPNLEEIFLGKSWPIHALMILAVHSDDVAARWPFVF
jgi:hypothetical protein